MEWQNETLARALAQCLQAKGTVKYPFRERADSPPLKMSETLPRD